MTHLRALSLSPHWSVGLLLLLICILVAPALIVSQSCTSHEVDNGGVGVLSTSGLAPLPPIGPDADAISLRGSDFTLCLWYKYTISAGSFVVVQLGRDSPSPQPWGSMLRLLYDGSGQSIHLWGKYNHQLSAAGMGGITIAGDINSWQQRCITFMGTARGTRHPLSSNLALYKNGAQLASVYPTAPPPCSQAPAGSLYGNDCRTVPFGSSCNMACGTPSSSPDRWLSGPSQRCSYSSNTPSSAFTPAQQCLTFSWPGTAANSAAWVEPKTAAGMTRCPNNGYLLIAGGFTGSGAGSIFSSKVIRSTDDGVTWSDMGVNGAVAACESVQLLCSASGKVYAVTGRPSCSQHFQYSEDYGASWSAPEFAGTVAMAREFSVALLVPSSHNTDFLVIAGDHITSGEMNDVHRYIAETNTFVIVCNIAPWPTRSRHSAIYANPSTLVLWGGSSGGNMVWRSKDDGATWVPIQTSLPWDVRAGMFQWSVLGVLYAGFGGANDLWSSSDAGTSWWRVSAATGVTARSMVFGVVSSDMKLMVCGGEDPNVDEHCYKSQQLAIPITISFYQLPLLTPLNCMPAFHAASLGPYKVDSSSIIGVRIVLNGASGSLGFHGSEYSLSTSNGRVAISNGGSVDITPGGYAHTVNIDVPGSGNWDIVVGSGPAYPSGNIGDFNPQPQDEKLFTELGIVKGSMDELRIYTKQLQQGERERERETIVSARGMSALNPNFLSFHRHACINEYSFETSTVHLHLLLDHCTDTPDEWDPRGQKVACELHNGTTVAASFTSF